MFQYSAKNASRWLMAISVLSFLACKNAQKVQTGNTTVVLDAPLVNQQSLLWQISGNGLEKPSYLFGTIHMIAENDYFLGQNTERKIRNADVLVMEMDLSEMNPAALAQASILPDNKTVKDYLDPDDYEVLARFFEDSIGFSPEIFEKTHARLKPFFLEQVIYMHFMGENLVSYEKNFQDIAEDNGITMGGLETMQQQISYLDKIPLTNQLENLVNTIRNYATETNYLQHLIEVYKTKNIDSLHNMIAENESFGDTMMQNLLTDRNIRWLPIIERFMKKGSCFFGVGAGHLGGEKGLIQLLRAAGYTVEPISED